MSEPSKSPRLLVLIGALKLVSGLLLFAVGVGLFRYLRGDLSEQAEYIVWHLHLDPNNRLIHRLLAQVPGITPGQIRLLKMGTFFYAVLHTVEGTGLILRRHWAEYLVVVATGSLLPFEIYELSRKLTPVRIGVFAVNLAILLYLLVQLRRQHQQAGGRAPAPVAQ